jgi:hypothetical protein
MKNFVFLLIFAFLCDGISAQKRIENDTIPADEHTSEQFSPKTLIIFFAGRKSKTRLLKAVKRYKAKVIYQYRMMNGMAIAIPDGKTLDESITYFEHVKGVISVQKDRICHLD